MPFLDAKRGFTLIEILVALTIIGVLISVGTVAFNNTLDKGRDNRRKQDLASIKAALILFFEDNHYYPPLLCPDTLPSPCEPQYSSANSFDPWIPELAPYIKKLPRDPRQAGLNIFSGLASLFRKTTPQFPRPVYADNIVSDPATSDRGNGIVTLSWPHTVSVGTQLLLVGVSTPGHRPPTNVTYAGQNITSNLVGTASTGSTVLDARMDLYQLPNPPTGTNTVAVTHTVGDIAAGAQSFAGLNPSAPMGAFIPASGNSGSPSVNLNSAADELVVDVVAWYNITFNVSAIAGSGQLEQWQKTSTSAYNAGGAGSTKQGAATVTMSWGL